MTEEQLPTIQITSPLQLLTLPLDILQQTQFQMSLATVKAMGGDAAEGDAAEGKRVEAAPDTPTIEPDRLLNRTNVLITKAEKIIDENIPGHVDEILIKSTSNFSIELMLDDHPLFHESMTRLIDLSVDIVSIVAIYSGGIYRFSITDLTYNKLFLRVFVSGGGTFDIFRKFRRDPYAD